MTLLVGAEQAREAFASSWGTLTPIDDGSCEFRTSDDDLDWLALRILMLGADFEVHEPPELIARLESLAARIGRATAG